MKKILLVLVTLLFMQCSVDDALDCKFYSIRLGTSCDCNTNGCTESFEISLKEYNRIMDLKDNATDPCIFIETVNIDTNEPKEGFLINMAAISCGKSGSSA